ncbi:MAG TPA: hypothetical protein VK173_01980 [Lacibacter sp.]|nr:hypothetical protein [Lacibacter sp.]
MRSLCFILFSFFATCSFAQDKMKAKQSPFKFETIVQGGLLIGDHAEAATIQTVNGFALNNWYAGIGVGLDFYMQRGVPLFADLRYHFSEGRKAFFIYTDAGVHLPWIKNKDGRNIISQSAGLYTDAGIGIRIATKKQDAFLISAGYSYKHVKEKQEGFNWQPWPQPSGQTVLNYDYRFNRVVLKFGFQF